MKYICNICNKEFYRKSHYDSHNNRKNKCFKNTTIIDVNNNNLEDVDKVNQNVNQNVNQVNQYSVHNVNQVNQNIKLSDKNNIIKTKTYNCLYCDKKYLSIQALSRHKKKHSTDNNISYDDLLEKYNSMENKLIELSEIINKQTTLDNVITTKSHNMKTKETNTNSKNTQHINSHNTNTQNINTIKNLNINIANYGSENLNKLTHEEQQRIINSNSDAIYTMLELLHHNPRLKEYHNIYANNLRSKNIHLYNEGRFIVENKKKTIEQMISNMAYNIETIINQTRPISSRQKKLLHDNFNWLKDFEINIEDVDGNFIRNDQKLIDKYKNIYNKYETLLYNNRNFALDTINLNKINDKIIEKNYLVNNELTDLANKQINYLFTDV